MDGKLLKNIISLIGIQGVNYLIPLITLPYLVVTLGPESYGGLSFSLAFVQYFVLFVDYGFNLSATKQVSINADSKENVSTIFWHVILCKIILFLLSLVVVFILIDSNDYLKSHTLIIFSSFGLVLGNVMFPVWLFQGLEKMGIISIINIVSRLFSIPLIFIVVKSPNDDWIAAMIYSTVAIMASIIALIMVIRLQLIKRVKISVSNIKYQFSNGWHLFISSASVSLYTTSVTVILGFVAGSGAVGYFVSADKIRQAFQGLIGPVSQACYPRINSVLSKDRHKGVRLIRTLLKVQGLFTFLISVFLFAFANYIIHRLYGGNYENSVIILQILALCPAIVGVSNVLGIQTMLTMGHNKAFSNILLSTGFISLILIGPLTFYMKEYGAAVSILISESVVMLAMVYYTCIKNKLLTVNKYEI